MNEYLPSVCPHDCPSACALEVERIDPHTIGKVRGAKENSYTQGVVCGKVAKYTERVHHPARLSEPLIRSGPKGSGAYKVVTWNEALDRVANEFSRATAEYGSESVWPYAYAGTMGQLQRDGIIRLRNAFGYSAMKSTICSTIAYAGWKVGTGSVRGTDPREMRNSDLIVIWGCNAVATQVNVMKLVAQTKHARNTKVVVIDPSVTGTAKKADIHLALKPGTDGALAAAVMHCAFRDQLADWDYLQHMTDNPHGLQETLQDKTPTWAAKITGLSEEQIEHFAQVYNNTKRSFIRLGIGFSRSRNGAHNVHSVACLPAVTGAWQHPGGGALLGTSGIFTLDKSLIEGTDMLGNHGRELDMSRIGAVLTGQTNDLKDGPPVKAMLIQNTNPMAVAPDSNRVRKGFMRGDLFVCVHEQFMTETAKMADVILPATSCVEHADIYTTYGHTHLQAAAPVINPYANCRSNHEVICELAQRLGTEDVSFTLSAERMLDQTLRNSGYPDYQSLLKQKWLDCAKDADMSFAQGFDWPDGKFHFQADWSKVGENYRDMPTWPGHWAVIEQTTPKHPFRLTTPPARWFLNSSFTQSPSSLKKEGRPCLRIHPDDADKSNIVHDQLVEIGNDLGKVKLHAAITASTQPGVLEVRGVWPGSAFVENIGINALISAESIKPNGGAAFHDAVVWLRAV